MRKNVRTLDFLQWLQLSQGKHLRFAKHLIRNAEARSLGSCYNQRPFIYVVRTLVECSWKFAEILPRMKNLEARFEAQISLAYQ
jgi:hypothetical protein